MFEFARQNSQNINVGRKQKHGSNISVQSTAPPRRLHRAVGRSVAGYGRKGAHSTSEGVGRNWGQFEPKNDCNWD